MVILPDKKRLFIDLFSLVFARPCSTLPDLARPCSTLATFPSPILPLSRPLGLHPGVYLLWEEEQGVPRFKRRVYFKMEKGEVDSLPPPMGRDGKSLWLLDFELFAAKLRGEVSVDEVERQTGVVIHIHQLCEQIEKVCREKGVVTAQ